MNTSSSATRATFLRLAWVIGGALLVAAPLVIFLRANAYLNNLPLSSLPTFPIDDGYIYSNYVRHAVDGHWFSYQDSGGEFSGGVTSLLWYLLLTLTYLLVHILGASLGTVSGLEMAAYLLGALLLASSATLMFLLARLLLAPLVPNRLAGLRPLVVGLPLLMLLFSPHATWSALSGLELPLSMALVLAALYALFRDLDEQREPGIVAALFAGLLPWARPELAAVGLLLIVVVLLLAARGRYSWALALRYLLIVVAIGIVVPIIYLLGTGLPLPSSFYAKTGQLAFFSPRIFQAAQQLFIDGGWPFLALFAAAALTGLFAIPLARRSFSAFGLLVTAAVLIVHTVAISAASVWYGQMDRYLLPVFPLALLLVIALPLIILSVVAEYRKARISASQLGAQDAEIARPTAAPVIAIAAYVALAVILVASVLQVRDSATAYAIQARNIADAHIAPAAWILTHTTAGTVVATEPVGAMRLFSQRPTLDVVGLTTPGLLGHYLYWDYTWRYLHAHNAAYLLFYPRWFHDEGVNIPPWLKPAVRFEVPDNLIAGGDQIVLYQLDWSSYHP